VSLTTHPTFSFFSLSLPSAFGFKVLNRLYTVKYVAEDIYNLEIDRQIYTQGCKEATASSFD
jgi:hypothetical protein